MLLDTARLPWCVLRDGVIASDTPIAYFEYATAWPSDFINLNTYPFKFANGLLVAFYGTENENEIANYKLYGRTRTNGPIQLLLTGVVTLGAQACLKHPTSGAAITDGLWADTITVTGGIFSGTVEIVDSGSDRICMLRFDSMHIEDIFMEIEVPGAGQVASISSIMTGY